MFCAYTSNCGFQSVDGLVFRNIFCLDQLLHFVVDTCFVFNARVLESTKPAAVTTFLCITFMSPSVDIHFVRIRMQLTIAIIPSVQVS